MQSARRAERGPHRPNARLVHRILVPRKASPTFGWSLPGNVLVVDPAKAIRPGPSCHCTKEKRSSGSVCTG